VPAGGFTVDLGDQEVAGSLRSHTEDAPLDDHPQDSRTRPTRRRRRTCFVAVPALLIRLPLTPDCRTMSEARAAGKAGPPAHNEAAPAARQMRVFASARRRLGRETVRRPVPAPSEPTASDWRSLIRRFIVAAAAGGDRQSGVLVCPGDDAAVNDGVAGGEPHIW
jgi:hypothetical protein